MRSLAIAVVLISGTIQFAAPPTANVAPLFQPFCNDGDGPLSGWLDSRYEAYLIGRDHELANRGHRWDILVQSGETVVRVPIPRSSSRAIARFVPSQAAVTSCLAIV